jgi:hypothetical protein
MVSAGDWEKGEVKALLAMTSDKVSVLPYPF